ncbi:MAG: DUF3667 domain-containing protein [Saprospiraceae bacterium]|nr:DUF3667 domain-containing protein [Saprospiraceae bacterium]
MLFRNPGKVIRDYIGGSTMKYTSPVRYLLIWITISFLVYFGFGLYEQQAAEMTEAFSQDYTERQRIFQEKWGNIVKNYAQVFGMILVPMYAIFSRLLFRRRDLNFAEHLVANAYFSAQAALIGALLNPLILLATDRFSLSLLFGFSVSVAYYTVGLRSLFAQRWVPAFLKTLLIIFFGFIGYSIVLSIVGAVVGIIFAMSGNI